MHLEADRKVYVCFLSDFKDATLSFWSLAMMMCMSFSVTQPKHTLLLKRWVEVFLFFFFLLT